jgi:aryl-alcohol dehydrogenase-like predicted oxidoreductase
MSTTGASASGQFRIGEITINRLGYGAMRITGPGVWGPPSDRNAAIATLRRLPEIGVNFIDTADSYGPDLSEELIREALHPYRGLLIATTAGQIALAWLLQHSPVILPIPGTLRVAHLEEDVAAAGLALTREEIAELDAAA